MRGKIALLVLACAVLGNAQVDARRKGGGKHSGGLTAVEAAAAAPAAAPAATVSGGGHALHWLCAAVCFGIMVACMRASGLDDKPTAFRRCAAGIAIIFLQLP